MIVLRQKRHRQHRYGEEAGDPQEQLTTARPGNDGFKEMQRELRRQHREYGGEVYPKLGLPSMVEPAG